MSKHQGATKEGTAGFFERHHAIHPDKVQRIDELCVSAVGLGTYLGDYNDATDSLYTQAIKHAVQNGCNLIDTAINYRCQRSERLIGKVLASLFKSKALNRDEVVVATKGGFIPFDSKPPSGLSAYIQKKLIKPGIVKSQDIVLKSHCMSPSFLQHQIDESLKNLQLKTLDIYYLHCPEVELPVIGPKLFYQRLSKAFEILEANVSKGKIGYYGLATWNGLRELPSSAEAISLERVMYTVEKAVGPGHHLKVIQLPYNMAMLEAVGVYSQSCEGKSYPIIPVASHYGLSVMISAPLLQGQLLQLPEVLTSQFPGKFTISQKALQFVISTPSVTAAMVGMKTLSHVDENLKIIKESNWAVSTLQGICDLVLDQ